jgi:hypothetical protein
VSRSNNKYCCLQTKASYLISHPPPVCIHKCGILASPYKSCGPPVGWSWPVLVYTKRVRCTHHTSVTQVAVSARRNSPIPKDERISAAHQKGPPTPHPKPSSVPHPTSSHLHSVTRTQNLLLRHCYSLLTTWQSGHCQRIWKTLWHMWQMLTQRTCRVIRTQYVLHLYRLYSLRLLRHPFTAVLFMTIKRNTLYIK